MSTASVCRCDAYNWPHRRGGGICGKGKIVECQECDGTGLDRFHRWFDGTAPQCESCCGYGRIDGRTEDERLDDPRHEEVGLINRENRR